MKLNLSDEVILLQSLFRCKIQDFDHQSSFLSNDSSFRESNWLITFPYNYFYLNPSNIHLIRELALLNSLYLVPYFAEDNVLDEYHLSKEAFKTILLTFISSHQFKNSALLGLTNLYGSPILEYYKKYEGSYYRALMWEKELSNLKLTSLLNDENLFHLGAKLLPLNLTFVGFCMNFKCEELIEKSENLLIQYHIAKQLCDDLIDVKKDLSKPDKSYLIHACLGTVKKTTISVEEILELLNNTDFKNQLYSCIIEHFHKALSLANDLNFMIFSSQLKEMLQKVEGSEFFHNNCASESAT